MEIDRKYRLRKEKIPYYFEDVLTRGPGVSLKMFEIFNGEEVRWGIREDYVSITDKKYCAITPLFSNMVDEKGFDRERIIYLKDYKFLIHGKLNGSEVIGKINQDAMLDQRFFEYENFGGKNVRISDKENNKVLVSYDTDSISKQIYFDCEEYQTYGNTYDVTYVNSYFIKSFELGDKVRVFVGRANFDTGAIYSKGYDVNKKEFINFPLDKNDFIDESEMIKSLNNESDIGFDLEFYKNLDKTNLVSLLLNLKIYAFDVLKTIEEEVKKKIKTK